MNGGWIKLHRSLTQHWVFDDPLLLKIWIDLLFMANHEKRKIIVDGNSMTIKRGQFFTSKVKLAERWNMDRRTVSRKLGLLQSEEMIFVDPSRKIGTLITIRNYENYQGDGTFNSSRKFKENQGFFDDQCTNECTNECTNDVHKNVHKQECKEYIKNEKEESAPLEGYEE